MCGAHINCNNEYSCLLLSVYVLYIYLLITIQLMTVLNRWKVFKMGNLFDSIDCNAFICCGDFNSSSERSRWSNCMSDQFYLQE